MVWAPKFFSQEVCMVCFAKVHQFCNRDGTDNTFCKARVEAIFKTYGEPMHKDSKGKITIGPLTLSAMIAFNSK